MRYIIGVDLGGTNLRAALADDQGTVHQVVRVPTGGDEGPEAVIDKIVACVGQVRAAVPEGAALLGVGVGSPGPGDPFDGIVFTLPNLPGWHNVPLRGILAERTGLAVELGNDANAAALGEWYFGAGRGHSNLVYVTVSTGIGGGVIADGRLLLGHRGAAAEVGHHIVDWEAGLSWENLAAGPALARAAAEAMAAEPGSALHQLATPATVTAGDVARAAAAGDALARRLMEREGELLGVGLVNLLHLYSPGLILLGGGVAINNPHLLERARAVIRARAMEAYRDVPVRLAELGDQAGLLGAVALFLHMREGRA
ncbi:MAG TPA: ROK family protein [Roseiflexaceae bacterium]|nr:ROK family protein [Roseiflexaceae bacterium]